MQQLLSLWYIKSGPWAVRRYLETVKSLDGIFAVGATWRHIGKPLFQDYTWQGRVIGVFLRIARIIAGYVTFFFAATLYVVAYIFWLLFPLICAVSLIGGFIGTVPGVGS